jgi:farnesyl-diphosphate farnesyltransferase
MSSQPVRDRRLCVELLPRVSRTFALSIEALPDSLRDAVRAAYLLCRVVDTIEDGERIDLPDRLRLFEAFDDVVADDRLPPDGLEALCAATMDDVDEAERQLCRNAGAVLRQLRQLPDAQRGAIRQQVQEMSRGMREYVMRGAETGGLRLTGVADLERYCYFVAGTVGLLLTRLFSQVVPLDDDAARAIDERAVSFGLGLQLVNIVKDVADDVARGNCFLPLSMIDAGALSPAELLDPGRRAVGLALVRSVCGLARGHLRRAQEYTELWPVPHGVPIRLFCAVPLALALATLEEVERGEDTLRLGHNPKVSRSAVSWILSEAQQAVTSNDRLDRFLSRLPI